MRMMTTAAMLTLLATPLAAQELVSQAKTWNLSEEESKAFSAKVVDIACELGGDCPDNCGDGSRQLGLVDQDGALVTVAKNTQASFNGAVVDLLPYCGQDVDVDGLMTGHGGIKLFQVQFIRPQGTNEWLATNNWTKAWAEANPEVAGDEGPWFRKDPRVLEQIARNGYLGLGLEEDARFIAEW